MPSFLRFLPVALAVLLCTAVRAEKSTPQFFAGGGSEISSRAPDRAQQAIRKWSEPGYWQGQDPAKAPYFWDFSLVGRHVYLRVIKNEHPQGKVECWLLNPATQKYELFKTYRVAAFSGGPGPKLQEGDLQAPEGFYTISRGRMNPASSYHLSMDIGYPNAYDRHHGRTGSLLMFHGKAVSLGCFAMTDASIEQLYTLVHAALQNGQPFVRVHCYPFRMTAENLQKHRDDPHFDFWDNLREGWDWFESHRQPANVEVRDGRYQFTAL